MAEHPDRVILTDSAALKLPAVKADRARRAKQAKSGSIRSAKRRKAVQEIKLDEIMKSIKRTNRSGR